MSVVTCNGRIEMINGYRERTFCTSDHEKIIRRAANGSVMTDTLPSPPPVTTKEGIGWQTFVVNNDSTASLIIKTAIGSLING